jgi:hypothetical protein
LTDALQAPLPSVWRINLKSAASAGVDPRRFCLDNDCLGVGWSVGQALDLDAASYNSAARAMYAMDKGWFTAVNALQSRIAQGDLCWTRDLDGYYYLGRITGPWRYDSASENILADIVNVRPCTWIKVGSAESVPGKVINSFRASRTLQRVADPTVQLYSAYVFNHMVAETYSLPPEPLDIFSLLSADDCEDLIALRMQLDAYLIFPSTCKISTVGYEWIMIHRESGELATAQVKSGAEPLTPMRFADFPGAVYLFTSQGSFVGETPSNVRRVSASEMRDFIRDHESILPSRIKNWIAISRGIASSAMPSNTRGY